MLKRKSHQCQKKAAKRMRRSPLRIAAKAESGL
jgi:hypothetical protein